MLERRFGLAAHGSDVRTETIAGATTLPMPPLFPSRCDM